MIFLTALDTIAPLAGLYGGNEERKICCEEEWGLPNFK
jgi:hypothetical protein